jgi:hypothetical protein
MQYPALPAKTKLRHVTLKEILRRVMHQVGTTSSLELAVCKLAELPGLEQGAGSFRKGHSICVEPGETSSWVFARYHRHRRLRRSPPLHQYPLTGSG